MMKNTIATGPNRTGISFAPIQGKEAVEGAETQPVPRSSFPEHLASVRRDYTADSTSIGSMPPPITVRGVAKAAAKMLKGEKAPVLLSMMGARLAFERAGVRLYEAMLAKLDVAGTWTGGPTRDEIERHCHQELAHFVMLKEALESLGADPTVVTPNADLVQVATQGPLKVVSDVRTNGPQGTYGILVAELADREGWRMLFRMAQDLGEAELAKRFKTALAEEETHLQHARAWVVDEALAEANLDSQQMSAE